MTQTTGASSNKRMLNARTVLNQIFSKLGEGGLLLCDILLHVVSLPLAKTIFNFFQLLDNFLMASVSNNRK